MGDRRWTMEGYSQEKASMDEKNGLTRRNFLKSGAMVTAVGAACGPGIAETASGGIDL